MCGISAIRAELRVSIQARGARNLVEGHLASAVLADSNLVIVPNPPRALLDDALELEAWIIPVPVDVDKTVEFDVPMKKNFLGLQRKPGEPTVVYLELTHRSMYASQIGHCNGQELGRALEEFNGDMWQALISIDAIPARLGDDIEPETLLAAAEAARQQRRPRRSDMEFDSYADLGVAFCWPWVCFCRSTPAGEEERAEEGVPDEAST
jgi:hypothetical protein